MIGRETLRETKLRVRRSFAAHGLDVELWLDDQMTKLSQAAPSNPEATKSLQLLRTAFVKQPRVKQKKKAPANSGKKAR